MTLRNPHADPRQRTDPPTFKQTEEPWKGNPERDQPPSPRRDRDAQTLTSGLAVFLGGIVVAAILAASIVYYAGHSDPPSTTQSQPTQPASGTVGQAPKNPDAPKADR